MSFRFLTPFAFLALVPIGGWIGGAWTFLAGAATLVALTGLDAALGEDDAGRPASTGRILPAGYIIAQVATTAWAATSVARPATNWLEFVGLAVSAGATTGVFGFVAAHEMIHSPDRRDRGLGLILLASVGYMHFRIAHVHGHHRRAATREDPASARLGESLYTFLPRTIAGQFREAWQFEAQRLRRIGKPVLAFGNRMVLYLLIEASVFTAIGLASLRALAFVAIVSLIAVGLLETFNYVAHYGLSRRIGPDGRAEKLGPRHSWNVVKRMNNAALFNMGRHSDHHRIMTRPYDELEPLAGAAELPSGYAAALVTALFPPLWRRVMDPRAIDLMRD